MDALLDVTVLFALVLAFSLLVERLLEALKCCYDLLDSRRGWSSYWTARATAVRDRLERKLRVFDYLQPDEAAAALRKFDELLLGSASGYTGTVPTISGDLVRALAVKVGAKLVGVAVGVGIAFTFGLDLVAQWTSAAPAAGPAWLDRLTASGALRLTLTGVAIGLGSGPVHKLITKIEDRRQERAAQGARP